MMKKSPRILLLTLLATIALSFTGARAQTGAPSASADLLTMLPASDVVLVVEHGRLWREAVPRILGTNMAPLTPLLGAAEEFKMKSGIDVRSINRIVVGLRLVNAESAIELKKLDKKDIAIVIISQGDFDANKFVEFMRREEKEKVREVSHGGQIIYAVDERAKGATQARPEVETPALAVLSPDTIALGDLMQVRATIDAKAKGGPHNSELLALIARDAQALVSLAGNVPQNLVNSFKPPAKASESETEKVFDKFFAALAAIKQLHIAIGLTPDGIYNSVNARLNSTEQAQSLGDMLMGARQQYGVFIEDKTIRDLVAALKIAAEGDEVRLRAEVPQTLIAKLLENARKKGEAAASSGPATKTSTAAKPATPATQTPKKKRRSTRRKRG